MGYWQKPTGASVYTNKGEVLSINNYMFSLAGSSRGSFACHFVDGADGSIIAPSKTDDYKFDQKAIKEGARKRFNLYNIDTRKFIV